MSYARSQHCFFSLSSYGTLRRYPRTGVRVSSCHCTQKRATGRSAGITEADTHVGPREGFFKSTIGEGETGLPREKREQSRFTPGSSTVDRILALTVLDQTRREYDEPHSAAYKDLKATLDSVDRDIIFKLLAIIGIPLELPQLFRGMYTETASCRVRIHGRGWV